MNNNIKSRNFKEITIQLRRAEEQKDILIKKIYREYEFYFHIVRKILHTSVEKGILGLYSDLSNRNDELNTMELTNFLNKNISLIIGPKLPFITIEQLMLENNCDPKKKLKNINALNELIELKEYKKVNLDYETDANDKESLDVYFNTNSNTYKYYECLDKDEFSSINLDESVYANSLSAENTFKKIEYDNQIIESLVELIEKTNDNKLNDYENINDQLNDVFISRQNLNCFEFIDRSFNNLLLNLSYRINSELFKLNLISKIISQDTFIFLSNNNYIIKHPQPFVITYNISSNNLIFDKNISTNIFLFNLNNVELEFDNLDLSICRNNIKRLKNKFDLLNKKERYWKNKELALNNLN